MEEGNKPVSPITVEVDVLEHEGLVFRYVHTSGFSDYQQAVPESSQASDRIELGIVLERHADDAMVDQVKSLLERIANGIMDNGKWLGHGHTLSTEQEISGFPMSDFVVMIPWTPFLTEALPDNVLLLIPIHQKELHFKQHEGTRLFTKRYIKAGGNEVWDAFRKPMAKRRFGLF